MSFIKKTLTENEEIISEFELHWINYLSFLVFLFIALVVVGSTDISIIIALILPIYLFFDTYCTEYALTNKRVIIKKGIISRKTEENILTKVETIEFKQGIIARIVGTGSVKITGTGESSLLLKNVENPIEVRKIIDKYVNLSNEISDNQLQNKKERVIF